jgi:putative restriction endonuclease
LDDTFVRAAAFAFLDEQTTLHGDVLPWSTLVAGFTLDGQRIPLVSQPGIFKPAVLADIPLTIRTTPEDPRKPRPYDDGMGSDGFLFYKYRGTDPQHRDNVGLRLAMQRQVPLIYLFGVAEASTCRCGPCSSSETIR